MLCRNTLNVVVALVPERVNQKVLNVVMISKVFHPHTGVMKSAKINDVTIRYSSWLAALAVALVSLSQLAVAADLEPETIAAWDKYVKGINARIQKPVSPGAPFLLTDQVPGQAAKLRAGEIVTAPAGPQMPLRVPRGLIHDWAGASFIPNARLDDVLRILKDYERYKLFYNPHVIDSELIASEPPEDRFSMLMINKAVISQFALRGAFRSSYARVNDQRYFVTAEATHLQEVANYGTPTQHLLPENEGMGLIWRLYSVARLEERDGGVYMDLEVVALSRDIPASVRWLVAPIVRRVSRSSLAVSLRQTEDAVRFGASVIAGAPGVAGCQTRSSCDAMPSSGSSNSFR